MGRAVRSPSTCLKTPQYFKEGRLKPFFANNVDIPFARARRLKPCPRKATVRSGKQPSTYAAVYIKHEDESNKIFSRKASFYDSFFSTWVKHRIGCTIKGGLFHEANTTRTTAISTTWDRVRNEPGSGVYSR